MMFNTQFQVQDIKLLTYLKRKKKKKKKKECSKFDNFLGSL